MVYTFQQKLNKELTNPKKKNPFTELGNYAKVVPDKQECEPEMNKCSVNRRIKHIILPELTPKGVSRDIMVAWSATSWGLPSLLKACLGNVSEPEKNLGDSHQVGSESFKIVYQIRLQFLLLSKTQISLSAFGLFFKRCIWPVWYLLQDCSEPYD